MKVGDWGGAQETGKGTTWGWQKGQPKATLDEEVLYMAYAPLETMGLRIGTFNEVILMKSVISKCLGYSSIHTPRTSIRYYKVVYWCKKVDADWCSGL